MTTYIPEILLIEDNPDDALLIEKMMTGNEDRRFNLVWVDCLSKGLEQLAACQYDVVLLDQSLPDVRGIEALKVILEDWPHIPVVIMTGLDDEQTARDAVFQGAQDYLVKGDVSERLLVRSVRYAIDRNAAQQENLANQKFLETLINSTNEGILTFCLDGIVKSLNPAAEKMFGYTETEIKSNHISMLVPGYLQETPGSQETLRPETSPAGRFTASLDMGGRRKDRAFFPIEISVSEMKLANQQLYVAIIRDISDRKAAEENRLKFTAELESRVEERTIELITAKQKLEEEAARRQEAMQKLSINRQQLRSIIDIVPHHIYTRTSEGKYLLANKKCAEFWGLSVDELVGKTLIQLHLDPEITNNLVQEDQEIIRSGRDLYKYSQNSPNAQGDLRQLQVMKTSFYDPETDATCILGVSVDITDLKKIQDELELAKISAEVANETKSMFLAQMSHEIRTPMNGVISMLKLLFKTDLDSKQHDYVETGIDSSKHLLHVINDILDFSKIEAGQVQLEDTRLDLEKSVDNISRLIGNWITENNIELLINIAPEIPRDLQGDPVRLNEILINLLSNAVKFTHEGEIMLDVQLVEIQAENVIVRFLVRDTGIGIPQDKLRFLFDPFTQADSSTTREYGGTGLGLSITKNLVELMGGRIIVNSKVGEGTTFEFTLSLKRELSREDPDISDQKQFSRLRVLVVDDHQVSRQIIREQLGGLGCQVVLAEGPDEAIHILHRAAAIGDFFEVALIDHNMPKTNGEKLCKWIQVDPKINVFPLVLMSSTIPEISSEQVREMGFVKFMSKPLSRHSLIQCLHEVMKESLEGTGTTFPAGLPKISAPHQPARNGIRILLAEDNATNQKVFRLMMEDLGYECTIVEDSE
jgi:PAS domain S-box-containing protein